MVEKGGGNFWQFFPHFGVMFWHLIVHFFLTLFGIGFLGGSGEGGPKLPTQRNWPTKEALWKKIAFAGTTHNNIYFTMEN